MDLIRAIEDTDEIDYESGSSNDEEDEDLRAPKTKKDKSAQKIKKVCADFDESYVPVFNQKEYMKDTWSEVSAYIRKKAKTTLTDKIAQVRKQRITDVNENNSDGDASDKDDDDSEEGQRCSRIIVQV